jgi:hypothetical protein
MSLTTPTKKGPNGDKRAGMGRFDVALTKFRAEALQYAGLFLGQRDRPIS